MDRWTFGLASEMDRSKNTLMDRMTDGWFNRRRMHAVIDRMDGWIDGWNDG